MICSGIIFSCDPYHNVYAGLLSVLGNRINSEDVYFFITLNLLLWPYYVPAKDLIKFAWRMHSNILGKEGDKFKMAADFRIFFHLMTKLLYILFFWMFVKLLLRSIWFWWKLSSYTPMPKSLGTNLLIPSRSLNYENIYLLFTYAVFSIMLPHWPSLACLPFLRIVIRIMTKLGLVVNW